MVNVEGFFKNQVIIFDAALQYQESLHNDLEYIEKDENANKSLNTMRLITTVQPGNRFNYRRIPELNALMDTVKVAHDAMLDSKRAEVLEIVRQCMAEIHTAAKGDVHVRNIINAADNYFTQQKAKIADCKSLALLDGMFIPMCKYKDEVIEQIEITLQPPAPLPDVKPTEQPPKKKNIKTCSRQVIFSPKTLETEADIDAYVEKVRTQLKQWLDEYDEIKIN